MDIKRRIVTSDLYFRRMLDTNKVDYLDSGDNSLILEINESDPKWPVIEKYVITHSIPTLSTPVFTQNEMTSAQWLIMRSRLRWGYPMPDHNGGYKRIVYNTENYCKMCGQGLKQKDLFRISNSPKWGKKHFLMLNWIDDELFISEKAKQILSNSSLKGIEYLPVYKYKSETKLENLYQLNINHILLPSFVPVENQVKKQITCASCGSSKWLMSGRGFCFSKNAFPNDVDIVKSYEYFGFGASASKKIIISQKFYKLVIKNHLDNGLEFIPINVSFSLLVDS